MTTEGLTFDRWLREAEVDPERLSQVQRDVLQAAFHFLGECGGDYYSQRVLGHFLLHAGSGLKVAQIARLLQISRQTASRYRKLSSKEVLQEAQNRTKAHSHGKFLPRYAGPIAEFLVSNPNASRHDVLDFVERAWQVRPSTVALHHFLKKYGLDRAARAAARGAAEAADAEQPSITVPSIPLAAEGRVAEPPQGFFLDIPASRAPSCSCPTRSAGSTSRGTASPTSTARSPVGC